MTGSQPLLSWWLNLNPSFLDDWISTPSFLMIGSQGVEIQSSRKEGLRSSHQERRGWDPVIKKGGVEIQSSRKEGLRFSHQERRGWDPVINWISTPPFLMTGSQPLLSWWLNLNPSFLDDWISTHSFLMTGSQPLLSWWLDLNPSLRKNGLRSSHQERRGWDSVIKKEGVEIQSSRKEGLRSSHQERRCCLPLIGLAKPHLCACPKPEPGFQRHMSCSSFCS
jgi:NOL1/NOP2/fmu family ribosome biogenesis protein